MSLRIRDLGNVTIVDVEGNVDINSSDIVETVGWLLNSGKLNIIINLESIDLVDYSGLSVLAISYKNVNNHNGKLKFLHVPLSVIELFRVVRLDAVFETFTDEKAAINSFFEEEVDKIHLRRKFKRLDMHLHVNYLITGDKNAKTYDGEVLNISGAGVYIYTHNTLPVTTHLDLTFILPDTHITLDTPGKVIWHADRQLQLHEYPGMGVSFIHLTAQTEKSIVDFIDKNITFRADS